MKSSRRLERHRVEQRHWDALTDDAVVRLVTDAGLLESRGGAVPGATEMAQVKLVPLSDRERTSSRSTANLFDLPTHYHHRFGSLGFGAWRELALHRQANDWVTNGVCPNFVLLRHARVLPIAPRPLPEEPSPWDGDARIAARVRGAREARACLALVQERFPGTLADALSVSTAPSTYAHSHERQLLSALDLCHSHGVLHLDPHLGNVLTDGRDAYLADFGLGTSRAFERTDEELAFAAAHGALDAAIVVTGLVQMLLAREQPGTPWRQALACRVAHAPYWLRPRFEIADRLGRFYAALRQDLTTPFPDDGLRRLIERAREARPPG